MTTRRIISGAPVRIRRKNGNAWLYLGRVKVGRIERGILEIKGHGKGNPTERASLEDVAQALVAFSRERD